MSFFAELKRRNVFKVGIAYLVGAWLLIQVSDILLDNIGAPSWVLQALFVVLLVGFFICVFVAWAFELTPEGIKRESDVDRSQSIAKQTGRKLDFIVIGVLVIAAGYFFWESRLAEKGSEPLAVEVPTQTSDSLQENRAPTPAGTPVQSAGSPLGEKSIAVLPFTNRSPNDDDIYFTDGVHDDLLTQLAKIGAFSVISRTSVMEYRDTEKNMKDIAAELGVANVMEGAVQRAGNRVRINVQLIDADTDEHLWAEVYDRELTAENLFDIQSEIAQAIANALHATLTKSEIALVSDAPTNSVEAYELFIQANSFESSSTLNSRKPAIDLYEEALRIDPQFKLAWLGLSKAHIDRFWDKGDLIDRQKSREALDKARAIDSDFPELYLAEGGYWYWGHLDYDKAIAYLQKAITLMPGNANAHMWLGWASRRAGEWDQAVVSMAESVRLNPRDTYNWSEFGQTFTVLHRFEEGRQKLDMAAALDPGDFWTKAVSAQLAINLNGDIETALSLLAESEYEVQLDSIEAQMDILMLAGDLEYVLQKARGLPEEIEVRRKVITLRQSWEAQALFFMGRHEEAAYTAMVGLERLQVLRDKLGDDFRIHMAQAQLMALAGDHDQLVAQVKLARDSEPADAMDRFTNDFRYARMLAIAGMTDETIALLEPLFKPPSIVSVYWVDLDPAFNDIRVEARFVEMMDRHR
jgi:TolB-like protein/Tfp pilus assembly protein PilF